jgi:hypothetical protein
MRPAIDIPRTNAANLEHPELVRMIAKANGAQVHELGTMWNNLGNEIIGFGDSPHRTATSSESIWVGQAATEARARLSELVTWCQRTGQGMQHMGTTVMRIQAEAAETAQMSMPAPVPYDPAGYQKLINSTSNPSEWLQIQGDAREQAARHDAAHAEAVRVIETYSASLLSTNGIMPAFTLPPEFGNRDTPPAPHVPAPHGSGGVVNGGAGGGPSGGGSPQIAPGSGGSGPGVASPGLGGGSPVPGGSSPGVSSPGLGGGGPSSGAQLSDTTCPGGHAGAGGVGPAWRRFSGGRGRGNRCTRLPARHRRDRRGKARIQRRRRQQVWPARLEHPERTGTRLVRLDRWDGQSHLGRPGHPGGERSRSGDQSRDGRVPPDGRWEPRPRRGGHRASAPQLPGRDRGHLG